MKEDEVGTSSGKIDFKKFKWYSKSSPKKTEELIKIPPKEPIKKPPKEPIKKSPKEPIKKSPKPTRKSTKKANELTSPRKKSGDINTFKRRKYLSPSAKIESKIPKVADLLKARKEQEKLENIDKLIKKTSSQFLKQLKNDNIVISEKPQVKELSCKHLTFKQLERRFKKDVNYLDDIFNGKIFSERHELFQKQVQEGVKSLKEDLRLSESVGAFRSDQLVYIISLFRERYDDDNKYKYSDYYFKVLLPEYCLKIYMDYHDLNKEQALEYLEKVPIPDLFEQGA